MLKVIQRGQKWVQGFHGILGFFWKCSIIFYRQHMRRIAIYLVSGEANRRRAQTFGGFESDQTSFEKIRSHRKYGLHVLQGERGDSTLAQPWKLCSQGDPIYFEKILFRQSSMLRTVDRWIWSILKRSFLTIFNAEDSRQVDSIYFDQIVFDNLQYCSTSFNPLSDQVLLLLDPKGNKAGLL